MLLLQNLLLSMFKLSYQGKKSLKKELLAVFIVLSLINTPAFLNATVSTENFPSTTSNELTFYTNSFTITASNASISSSNKVLAGSVYGGQTKYTIVASLDGTSKQPIHLIFIRDLEYIYINLDNNNRNWNGQIYFKGCCSNVLVNLYVQLQVEHNSSVTLNSTPLLVVYSIYKFQESTSSSLGIFGTSKNALGYPYPSRYFIIGLMIILIGMIPVTLVVLLLRKYIRRKAK